MILNRLKKFQKREFIDKLQNFKENLRTQYRIKLLKHEFYMNRKNLIRIVVKLKIVNHHRKNDKKQNKAHKKRIVDHIDDFKFNIKKFKKYYR